MAKALAWVETNKNSKKRHYMLKIAGVNRGECAETPDDDPDMPMSITQTFRDNLPELIVEQPLEGLYILMAKSSSKLQRGRDRYIIEGASNIAEFIVFYKMGIIPEEYKIED